MKLGGHNTSVFLLLSLCLAACTPEHTRQVGDRLGRSIGISEDYRIERWGQRVIARDSRLLISSSAVAEHNAQQLSTLVAQAFARAFSRAESTRTPMSHSQAQRVARERRDNFLLDIQDIETYTAEKSQHSDTDKNPSALKAIKIQMVLVDVVSRQVIDKFIIQTDAAVLSWSDSDLEGLLEKPLKALVQDLSGA